MRFSTTTTGKLMGCWHKLTDLHFRSSLGDVKQNTASRIWVAYDSIGIEVGRADDAATAMELVRNSNLTKDLRILTNPNTIKARIKEDALVMADELKARLVSQSQDTRRSKLQDRIDDRVGDEHITTVKNEIRRWAKMQGYDVLINDKLIELRPPTAWFLRPVWWAVDIISSVGNNAGLWKGLLFLF